MRPDDYATRAEIAVISNRLYDLTKDSFCHLIPNLEPAVVTVLNERAGAVEMQGSGVSVGGGIALTNTHVVLNPDGTTDKLYGVIWSAWGIGYAMAELVHLDHALDVAVLRVGIQQRGDMPVLPLGDSFGIKKAEPVAVLGSPMGLVGSVSVGIVSALGRRMSYEIGAGRKAVIPDMIQTDAAINPGNSGGALVNLRGELIGIPSMKLAHLALEGLGFCIGLDSIRQVLRDAGIELAPKPVMTRPDYERYGWYITAASHTMQRPVRYLVVHHEGHKTNPEGSSALDIHRWQITPKAQGGPGYAAIGYHAAAERNGELAEGRPLWAIGAHAAKVGGPDYNPESLGICIIGNLDQVPPTDVQLASTVAWLRWQKLLHPQAQIVGHQELPQMATSCPGKHLDMNALRAQVERR